MTIKIDAKELGEIIEKYYREKGLKPTGMTIKLTQNYDAVELSHIEVRTED